MHKMKIFIATLLLCLIPALLHTQTMRDYCSAPPSVTRSAAPNILFIVDNSAAMLQPFYSGEYTTAKAGDYTGYFRTDRTYCASSAGFYEAVKCEHPHDGPYPGSLLNWAAMSRYDLMMKILTGGLGTPEPSSRKKLKGINREWEKTTNAYPGCIFRLDTEGRLRITENGNCSLPDNSEEGSPVEITVSEPKADMYNSGIIQKLADMDRDGKWDSDAPRIGIIRYNPAAGNEIEMASCCVDESGSLPDFIDSKVAPYASAPDKNHTEAPLNAAIIRATDYFKHNCNKCACKKDPASSVRCRKNIIVVIGSGDATDSSNNINDLIKDSHIKDIRADLKGFQNIIFCSIHIAGAGAGNAFLKDIAEYGGFADMNGNNRPDDPEWDMNEDKIPDNYFEARNSAGFLAAVENIVQDIGESAASGTATAVMGSAANKAGSIVQAFYMPVRYEEGSRIIKWTGYLQSLWLDPDKNIREDTSNDFKLVLDQDNILRYYSDEKDAEAAFFSTNAEGKSCPSSSGVKPKSLTGIEAIWEAGRLLFKRNPSDRTIYTSSTVIRGEEKLKSEPSAVLFNANMQSGMKKALNPDEVYPADSIIKYVRGECLETKNPSTDDCGKERNPLFRDRRVMDNGLKGVWKLGDIVNSSPRVFHNAPLNTFHADYGDMSYYEFISDEKYAKNSSVVFTGANDGMLHAFRAGYLQTTGLLNNIKVVLKRLFSSGEDDHKGIGEELWGFIPYNTFPYLKYLADPNYCHISYVDMSVKLVDASVYGGPYAGKSKQSWRSVLVGSMRFGGASSCGGSTGSPPGGAPADVGFSAYFAIDITDPEKPVPLWEFSDEHLGYATSTPAIIRTGQPDKNGNWFVVFGSGSEVLPKGNVDIGRNEKGYLYMLDLYSGELVKKIVLNHGGVNHIVSDIVSVDADMDYKSERIYFGSAYYSEKWKGDIFSINVEKLFEKFGSKKNVSWTDMSHYGVCSILFSGEYPFTASPVAARSAKGDLWLYAGSGKYYSDADEQDSSPQIFMGIKDTGETVVENELNDTTKNETRAEVLMKKQICVYDSSVKRFTVKDAPSSVRMVSKKPHEPGTGWKIQLPAGQRIISRPMLAGGLADFVSYMPATDVCSYGGDSYLYAVEYNTGTAPADMAILSSEIMVETGGSQVTILNNIRIGSGAPAYGEAIMTVLPEGEKDYFRKKIQLATGAIAEIENKPSWSVYSRIMHWLKK